MNISSIFFLFFNVKFNNYTIPVNTVTYGTLWSLKMMLFTKYVKNENALTESAKNFDLGLI